MIIAVHGNPGFPQDFDLLLQESALAAYKTEAVKATELELEKALHRSPLSECTVIGYSWGAYLVLQTLLRNPKLQPRHVILVAPYLAPTENLSGLAKTLLRTPGLSALIVGLGKKKWQRGLEERMFHSKDLPAARHYLERLEPTPVWKSVVARKLLQESEPLQRAHLSGSQIDVIFAENDRISDRLASENLLRSRGLAHHTHVVAGAEHALIWTHASVLATEIARIVRDPTEKGSSL